MAAQHNCDQCAFRKKYDVAPKSFLGRLWRWHAGWCPGWKAYITSLPENERHSLAQKYQFRKYM
ncbi:MAG: hypothetical protein JXX29_19260 [Deltaproteobacteria bacterium]|nr:hypothetical protein [Deltaproteobacteria bacterium]MBN2673827.1 hypothetical protein [Deltaproteobacteria bacterium]